LLNHRDRPAFDCLRNEPVSVGLLAANRYKHRARRASPRIVRNVDCRRIELSARRDRIYFICEFSQLQLVLGALARGESPGGGFGATPSAIFLIASFESFTRQIVS